MNIKLEYLTAVIDERYMLRGKKYFEEGMVKISEFKPERVKTRVVGTMVYTVIFTFVNKQLKFMCSCPAFSDFGPCKHIAATGFAIIKYNKDGCSPLSQECKSTVDEYDNIKKLLLSLKKKELVELLLHAAAQDPSILNDYEF